VTLYAGSIRQPMEVLRSNVDVRSETYRVNREGFLDQLAFLDEQLALARAGGGEKYVKRHLERGKLMARERIELLLDRDSPFLELSPLAAWGTEFGLGGGVISGVGVVSGVECVITANEPTMKGGTLNPYSLLKSNRTMEVCKHNRLPIINLTESGGADLPFSGADLRSRRQDSARSPAARPSASRRSVSSSSRRPPAAPTCPACRTTW
jgi:acetyl-CoA carboxylase carboxyltransferase component